MADRHFIPLAHRALLALTGEDRKGFLQGLVSADVTKVGAERALYGAFLTPQGKFLHEFFLGELGDSLLLETESARRADFARRLGLYKLRSKVAVAQPDDFRVYALSGDSAAAAFGLDGAEGGARAFAGGLVLADPRLPGADLRAWLPAAGAEAALAEAGFTAGTLEDWDARRVALGLPDGSRDLVPEKSILLENGFDELRGIDWQKGCYMGQELTARTKYRGLIKKRLMPVSIDGPAPEAGTPVLLGETEAGEMRSHAGQAGLALLRLEILDQVAAGGALRAGEAVLHPRKPDWASF